MLKVFLSICMIFSLLTPSLVQEGQASPADGPQTGISLPASLGPLKRVETKKYDQPELGISYRYETAPLFKANIYIYDMGKKNLGTGINSPEVRAEMERSGEEIYTMEKRGRYRSVNQVSEGKTVLASSPLNLPALSAVYTFSQAPGQDVDYTGVRVAHLLLTAYKGYFVKIRFTYPQEDQDQGERAWQQLLADFGKTLK